MALAPSAEVRAEARGKESARKERRPEQSTEQEGQRKREGERERGKLIQALAVKSHSRQRLDRARLARAGVFGPSSPVEEEEEEESEGG